MRENLWENKKVEELGIINEEKDPKIKDTMDDQFTIGGRTDVSIEDFTDELNKKVHERKVIGDENGVAANEESWEEESQGYVLENNLNDLRIKYAKLREGIKERQTIINELRYSKNLTEKAVQNLNIKEMSLKERNFNVTEIMRNTEDRVERLSNKIRNHEEKLIPLYQELGELESIITSVAKLINSPDEKDTVGDVKYKFELN